MARVYTLLGLVTVVAAKCYDPFPAFPVPSWETGVNDLRSAFDTIAPKLEIAAGDKEYDIASFSVAVTSNTKTLWAHHHSARKHNATRPGVKHVDGDSQYRIASITKAFTTLGLLYQHTGGNLSLDDPVDLYLEALRGPDSGAIPWKDITLRILASQLAGIPRDTDQADLINGSRDPSRFGLPPVSRQGLPDCYEHKNFEPCIGSELLDAIRKKRPIFAPNQESTYSNANFELLGFVLSNVTGMEYSDYMQHSIFSPLKMTLTSLSKPSDAHAILPLGWNYWDAELGGHRPTGGIYSSSSDMSKFLRYVLTHFNSLATGVNWFMPASWATGMNTFYGMPFEIYRTDAILPESRRPVTFVTKGGSVPGYFSLIIMLPEYGLGITILTAGPPSLLDEIKETVTADLVTAAETLIWRDIKHAYSGRYVSTVSSLNSSIDFESSPSTGLIVNGFISNGTDVFRTLLEEYAGLKGERPWRAQLIPTLLFKNQTTQEGEIWRLIVASERQKGVKKPLWDEICSTDIDTVAYAGVPVNEVVFWHEEGVVELPAWRVKLKRVDSGMGGVGEKFVTQE